MPSATLNGIKIDYDVRGEGEPLLFISGLGGDRASWAAVTPKFPDRQCVIFDSRGTGKSDVPAGPYSIEEMATDTAALIGHLGIGPADVVGVSMGASVLQALAYLHPEAVRRAVFVSGFPNYTPVQHMWLDCLIALRDAGVDPVALRVMGMPWAMTARTLYDHEAAARMAKLGVELAPGASNEGFKAQAAGLRAFDSRPNLHKVSAPALVLVGAEDILTPPFQSVEMAELMPNARLQVLPRGGHGLVAEYTDDVVGAIKAFLGVG
ncbi:MAG: alpha/beta fold hydrolase [Dehalococcoidia bacterium]